jgi:hypothetical protein
MKKEIRKWKNLPTIIIIVFNWMEKRECCCNDMMNKERNLHDEISMMRILLDMDNSSLVDMVVITNSMHNSPTGIRIRKERRRPMIRIRKDPPYRSKVITMAKISILLSNNLEVPRLLIKILGTRHKDLRLLITMVHLLFIRITVLCRFKDLIRMDYLQMSTTTMQAMINSHIHLPNSNPHMISTVLPKTMALSSNSRRRRRRTIKSLRIKLATIPGILKAPIKVHLHCSIIIRDPTKVLLVLYLRRGEIVEVLRHRDEVGAEEDVGEVVAANTIEIVVERNHIKIFGRLFSDFGSFDSILRVALLFQMHRDASFFSRLVDDSKGYLKDGSVLFQ